MVCVCVCVCVLPLELKKELSVGQMTEERE